MKSLLPIGAVQHGMQGNVGARNTHQERNQQKHTTHIVKGTHAWASTYFRTPEFRKRNWRQP